VNPKALSVAGITANNKPYDGTTTATLSTSSAVLQGVISGDTVSLDISSYIATFASKNVANGIADCRGPPAPSPPVIRMRSSNSITADAFERACHKLAAEVHVPIAVCGKVAFRTPAHSNTPARIQRSLGVRFIFPSASHDSEFANRRRGSQRASAEAGVKKTLVNNDPK
jgi:hypothetical protein